MGCLVNQTACPAAFTTYAGRSFQNAAEGGIFFEPTADSWAAGDRAVVCVAVAPAGQKAKRFAGRQWVGKCRSVSPSMDDRGTSSDGRARRSSNG